MFCVIFIRFVWCSLLLLLVYSRSSSFTLLFISYSFFYFILSFISYILPASLIVCLRHPFSLINTWTYQIEAIICQNHYFLLIGWVNAVVYWQRHSPSWDRKRNIFRSSIIFLESCMEVQLRTIMLKRCNSFILHVYRIINNVLHKLFTKTS